jgi:autotransporter-associated beta strand protein
MFGNGTLDITLLADSAVTVGSIEGDGVISLGARTLSVGSNSLSTTFSGVIQDANLGGALSKIGSGTLTLTGSNTYTGGTTVTNGTLKVDSQIGSGTGTGAVTVTSGALGGKGTIGGPVTIGDGRGPRAFLEPAAGAKTPSSMTIESSIVLKNDAIYIYSFKARNQKSVSDEVTADGVTIEQNAILHLRGAGHGTLAQGLSFTVFNNTTATPIAGIFKNLPDGAIVNVNGTNFQASYEGGDGNDLTLTVVP